MAKSDLKQAIEDICNEKNIPYDSVIETIEAALAVAYRKDFGQPNENVVVKFNPEDSTSKIWDVKTVVEDKMFEEYEAEQKSANNSKPTVNSRNISNKSARKKKRNEPNCPRARFC